MSYGYARRIATAWLVFQGVFSMKDFEHAQKIFESLQMSTIQTKEFQELASYEAYKYIESYDNRLNMEVVSTVLIEVLKSFKENGSDIKTAKDLGAYYTVDDILQAM